MEVGQTYATKYILKGLPNEVKQNIEEFVSVTSNKKYIEFNNKTEVNNVLSNQINDFLGSLTEEELLDLRNYTGYNFRFINAILRNNWTYESLGKLTDEIKFKYLELAKNIESILNKFPNPDYSFMTYRGTTLSSFSGYGIKDIKDLIYLKDRYMYEQGFTSTSIFEDDSFYKKNFNDGKNYNIEVKYILSSDCQDGALLMDYDLTYSLSENEYLINKGALSKVVDVNIDEINNTAILTVVLIPKKLWNIQYGKDDDYSSSKKQI